MRRRDFISGLVVSSAIGRAHAQQGEKVVRLAMLSPSTPVADMTEAGGRRYRAFFQRLRGLGYVEGENLAVGRYSGEGRAEHYAELVAQAIRYNPNVIVVAGDRLAGDVKAATNIVPIIAIVSDPIASGIVTNMARPGGNITGVAIDAGYEFAAKCLERLHEVVPAASTIGYVASSVVWENRYSSALRQAAQRMKLSLVGPPLAAPFDEPEYRRVFAAMEGHGVDALIVNPQPENTTNLKLIAELALKYRWPALFWYREFTDFGGLMAYGVDLVDLYHRAADQVGEILKGTRPGDLPFDQPTKFPMIINLKTAKALGLTIPPTLLIAADEVIE
jgi:putative ABC transport system substrate-binding protein